jgi:DNA-binding GntR family transcriptional regulator
VYRLPSFKNVRINYATISDEWVRAKFVVRVAVIAQTTGAADMVERRRLQLADGDQVLRISRIRLLEGDRPASYEIVVLPLARFPGISPAHNMTEDIFGLARAHGLVLGRAREEFGETYAAPEVADCIGVDSDEAVLKLDRVVQSSDGVPLEWRVAYFGMDSDRFDG